MGKPRTLYDNSLLSTGVVLDSTDEDVGYPVENLSTWRDYDVWSGVGDLIEIEADFATNQTINCIGVVNHNLNDQAARWKLEKSDNIDSSAPTWTVLVDWQTPSDDLTFVEFFTETTTGAIKFSIDNGAASADVEPYIGILFVGTYMEFDRNPVLPLDPDKQKDHGERQRGGTGKNLGYALDFTERNPEFIFKGIDPDWVTDYWLPFLTAHRTKPFIWLWDYAGYPNAAYLMELDMDQKQTNFNTGGMYREFVLKLKGVLEE